MHDPYALDDSLDEGRFLLGMRAAALIIVSEDDDIPTNEE